MFPRHWPLVSRRTSRGPRPEISNFFEVRSPVPNMGPKNRPDQLMLSHIRMKCLSKNIDRSRPPILSKSGTRV